MWVRTVDGRYVQVDGGSAEVPYLTARQRDVLTLVAQGKTNPAIARALVVELKTVERHLGDIYRTLFPGHDPDVQYRVAAALWWVNVGKDCYQEIEAGDLQAHPAPAPNAGGGAAVAREDLHPARTPRDRGGPESARANARGADRASGRPEIPLDSLSPAQRALRAVEGLGQGVASWQKDRA